MTYLTHEELEAMDKDGLAEYAESIGTKVNKAKKEENIINDILGFQELNPLDEDKEEEDSELSEYEQALQAEKEETQEEIAQANSQPVITNVDDSQANFLDAFASIMRDNNQSKVHANTNLLKSPEGKKIFNQMKRESEQMVLIRLHKNNTRMQGEKWVMFDIGNEVYSIAWNIRLGVNFYVPKILIPEIQQRAYQRFEMSDEAINPVVTGNGDAVTTSNFLPSVVPEYQLTILEDTGETREQIIERLSKKKQPAEATHGEDLFNRINSAISK